MRLRLVVEVSTSSEVFVQYDARRCVRFPTSTAPVPSCPVDAIAGDCDTCACTLSALEMEPREMEA
jgi:hypothetical protein